jgi:hypothetical protein
MGEYESRISPTSLRSFGFIVQARLLVQARRPAEAGTMKLVSLALRRPDLAFDCGHSGRIGRVRGARSHDGDGSLVYSITYNRITPLGITTRLADVTEATFGSQA